MQPIEECVLLLDIEGVVDAELPNELYVLGLDF